jgi:hypothetical protein
MEISGYRYPVKATARTGFSRVSLTNGWATWRRAWSCFEQDGRKLLAHFEASPRAASSFDIDGGARHMDMLRDQVRGRIGGWDIRWQASMFLHGGLSLYPATSLTNNLGWDGSGINVGSDNRHDAELSKHPIEDFPERIEDDREFRAALRHFFLSLEGPPALRASKRLLRKIDRKLPLKLSLKLRKLYIR